LTRSQTVRTTIDDGSTPLDPSSRPVKVKKMSFVETLRNILQTDGAHGAMYFQSIRHIQRTGILALWHGLGPALVLVAKCARFQSLLHRFADDLPALFFSIRSLRR
jgi:hypothetical protein